MGDSTRQARTALAAALDQVGDRWSLLVVEALLSGPRRWSELSQEVSGIAPNVLSDRLQRLERQGVVTSEPYSDRPLRHTYGLSAAGLELAGALRLLADWGAGREEGAVAPRHQACGTPMGVRWHCPTCDLTVEGDPPDAEIVTV